MRHIGIYPGTFDPIHSGHIVFAQKAGRECRLDTIFFLPENKPRNKHNVTSIHQRIHHIKQSIQAIDKLELHESASSRFSVTNTLDELETAFSDAHLTLLIGSDVALHMYQWPDIHLLVHVFQFAIGMRTTESLSDVEDAMKHLSVVSEKIVRYSIITTPHPGMSSSQFRSH